MQKLINQTAPIAGGSRAIVGAGIVADGGLSLL